MKTLNPHIEIIEQEPGMLGVYKQIEIAGRTCYKSEDNITDESAEKFAERMIMSGHGAMLEHGTLYLDIPMGNLGDDNEYMWKSSIIQFFKGNQYSRVNKYKKTSKVDGVYVSLNHYAITTNYRVFIEQIPWDKLGPMRRSSVEGFELGLEKKYVLSFMCEPTEHHDKRITIKMFTDRGVSAEANRHRVDSIAEQSTRYCNYSKDKFGNEITIALNADIKDEDIDVEYNSLTNQYGDNIFEGLCDEIVSNFKDSNWSVVTTWLFANLATEWSYMKLIELGWSPQQARRVLPLDLHTEIVHTAYEDDWKHFIDLRSEGTTGKPHPDMKMIGDMIKEKLNL